MTRGFGPAFFVLEFYQAAAVAQTLLGLAANSTVRHPRA